MIHLCQADHSPPSDAEVKNVWSIPWLPPYVFMAWCSVKLRVNVTFTFLRLFFVCLFVVLEDTCLTNACPTSLHRIIGVDVHTLLTQIEFLTHTTSVEPKFICSDSCWTLYCLKRGETMNEVSNRTYCRFNTGRHYKVKGKVVHGAYLSTMLRRHLLLN
jgi:hypothetical protein